MKVKIGGAWTDSKDRPIAVELNDEEREQIAAMKPEDIAAWAQIVMHGDPSAKEPPGVIEATTALHRTLRRRADQHVPEAEETARMFGKRGAK